MNVKDIEMEQDFRHDLDDVVEELKKIRHEIHLPVPNPAPLGT